LGTSARPIVLAAEFNSIGTDCNSTCSLKCAGLLSDSVQEALKETRVTADCLYRTGEETRDILRNLEAVRAKL